MPKTVDSLFDIKIKQNFGQLTKDKKTEYYANDNKSNQEQQIT